ncbi:Short chain dehydrogenase AgnL6 [Pseudocercospora fuligena]|uniref:Short chain dehydrogenase AgnL6 n=1 Tax=Pseudocercospora fuligena TaxID=685502 RepID=A0A8H6VBP5_9PEZI|nr:Short chain dehydrogenase AgnL6 [Pseudocercospora fuligena]
MSSGPLSGKVALITGGSKGIGASLSTRLASLGATVVINYSSDSKAADDLVSKIKSSHPGSSALAIQADASSISGADTMIQTTIQNYKKLDILICCAGILPMKDVHQTTESDFDKTFALNVKGPYFLVQKSIPHMATGGRIVLFSTTLCAASTVTPNYLLYNSTKGAIEQMTKVLAKDPQLAEKKITVNCASPGPTATELFMKGKPEGVIKAIGNLNPYGRIGEPDEVADAITMLVGEESRWVNGQVLRINGGMA